MQQVNLAGVRVDLVDLDDAVDRVTRRASRKIGGNSTPGPPLSVVSANLDHIAQFGSNGRWYQTLDYTLGRSHAPGQDPASPSGDEDWLILLDGAPLVAEANRLTGRQWPRLAGSDIIGPLLDRAEAEGLSVGFLGGSYLVQRVLSRSMARNRPHLKVSGLWAPERKALADHDESLRLAEAIRASQTQILVVGLGKPRQELWMAKYGPATGANVLLAFGAVVDFLAGSVRRAPAWASQNGLEWAWRLALEPRRLAKRYLVDNPPSLLTLRRDSHLLPKPGTETPETKQALPASGRRARRAALPGTVAGRFSTGNEPADICVVSVTYNNADTIGELISTLRDEAGTLALRVVVADNDSRDETCRLLEAHPDVHVVETGGNLGYAGGLNAGMAHIGDCSAVLVLNPDLRVEPGAISIMAERMSRSGAGIVVPRLLESGGTTYHSLRREPSLPGAFGDAIFGSKFASRPGTFSELDYDAESYQHPHRVEWATGAALLVRTDLVRQLGPWDERFFLYSEETDYFRRARELGETAWYEPAARMTHHMGGSGASRELNALMAVNRIRYVSKHHSPAYARRFKRAVVLSEALRSYMPEHRWILRTLLDESSWDRLPGPSLAGARSEDPSRPFPSCSVVIPAHNEAAVIGRTLARLAPLAASGEIEVIVACNGCSDDTARIAGGLEGVTVLELTAASKTKALNAADAAASRWPRVYLDADIELDPTALRLLLEHLEDGSVLAARPAFIYDDAGAAAPVRAFYRARRRIPSTNRALWGAGIYAVGEAGHARFGVFPDLTADDLFIDRQFGTAEKSIVDTPPVRVRTPLTSASLHSILKRNYRGQTEYASGSSLQSSATVPGGASEDGGGLRQTGAELWSSVRGPRSAVDAVVYTAFVLHARLALKRGPRGGNRPAWERDESSRRSPEWY